MWPRARVRLGLARRRSWDRCIGYRPSDAILAVRHGIAFHFRTLYIYLSAICECWGETQRDIASQFSAVSVQKGTRCPVVFAPAEGSLGPAMRHHASARARRARPRSSACLLDLQSGRSWLALPLTGDTGAPPGSATNLGDPRLSASFARLARRRDSIGSPSVAWLLGCFRGNGPLSIATVQDRPCECTRRYLRTPSRSPRIVPAPARGFTAKNSVRTQPRPATVAILPRGVLSPGFSKRSA